MTKILVTGGAGFIGSHVVHSLLQAGAEVCVLDDLSSGRREAVSHHRNCTFIKGNVADEKVVAQAMAGCSHVVHLAALVSVPESIDKPDQTFTSNVVGMQNLLKVARDQKLEGWFLYASSAAVYGANEGGSVVEKDANGANLQSPYAASKVQNEIQAKLYRDLYGVHTLGMRFFNVYGPGQLAESPYSALMAKLMDSVLNGSLLTIYGDGKQTRDFISVRDVALVAKMLLQLPLRTDLPPVVNVGCGVSVSILDAIRAVVALKRINPRVEYRPKRQGDIQHSCADISALCQLLPTWTPKTLQEGLREWLVEVEKRP